MKYMLLNFRMNTQLYRKPIHFEVPDQIMCHFTHYNDTYIISQKVIRIYYI